jgi:hypothetical protein
MLSGVDGTKVTEGQPNSLVGTRSLLVSTAIELGYFAVQK